MALSLKPIATKILNVTPILLGLMMLNSPSLANDEVAVPEAKIEEHRKITVIESTDEVGSHTNNPISYASISSATNPVDSITLLIQQSEQQHNHDYASSDVYASSSNAGIIVDNLNFDQWLTVSPYRVNEVAQYQSYLSQHVGIYNVPPMNQLLTTARSWEKCGYEPYQIPPRHIWSNMIATLKLYSVLKSQGVLPQSTVIRSVYRSPELNACAGGAAASKHLTNGAIDVWVPEYDGQPWYISPMQDKLCDFWRTRGEAYNFGLGIYRTGAVHLDTQGYRRWGMQHTTDYSTCRIVDTDDYADN